MILIDANILVYAHVSSFTQHERARNWLDQQLNAVAPVGLPWESLVAFLRLVTNPRVFDHPEPIGDAWQQVRTWLAAETAWVPHPTPMRPPGAHSAFDSRHCATPGATCGTAWQQTADLAIAATDMVSLL